MSARDLALVAVGAVGVVVAVIGLLALLFALLRPRVVRRSTLIENALEQRDRILGNPVDPESEITPIWKLLYGDERGADMRAMGPTRECACGCDLWRALVQWDEEGEVSFWFLDVVCASCGTLATALTPLDVMGLGDEELET